MKQPQTKSDLESIILTKQLSRLELGSAHNSR